MDVRRQRGGVLHVACRYSCDPLYMAAQLAVQFEIHTGQNCLPDVEHVKLSILPWAPSGSSIGRSSANWKSDGEALDGVRLRELM